jgi:subtilisin family serine protease
VKSLTDRELKEFAEDAKIGLGRWGVNTERIIVKFKDAETEQEVLRSLKYKTPLKNFKTINAKTLRLPKANRNIEVLAHLGALRELSGVEYAYPDIKIRTVKAPNDEGFSQQWSLNNTGATTGAGKGLVDADIDAPEAWEVTTGSKDVIVGLIDTGVDYTNPDLAPNIWLNPGETGLDSDGNNKSTNGIDDDGNGYVDDFRGWDFVNNDNDPMDEHGHGTHTAGTIGAVGNNSIGVSGVAWQVSIVPLQIFDSSGSGDLSAAMAALEYATLMKFPITNNSWGWSGGEFIAAFEDLLKANRDVGGLFVAAAGNDSTDNDVTPFFPASYQLNNVISVAASDNNDRLASFSNYGKNSVHLVAPGVNILSTYLWQQNWYDSGTSMAAPHVTGGAVLIKTIHPSFSYEQIKSKLIESVDEIVNPFFIGKTISGGRLNLARAVDGTPSPLPYRLSLKTSTPSGGPPSGQTKLTLKGTGFHSGTAVTLGLKPCTSIEIVSQMELNCLTPASAILGLHNVLAANPDGAKATLSGAFRYVSPPSVTSVTPQVGPISGGNTLTVSGTQFVVGTTVKVGEKNCTQVRIVSSGQLTCTLPDSPAGTFKVTVIDPYNQASAEPIQYTYRPAPQLTSIAPPRGNPSGGGTLTLTGTGFVEGATIALGSRACTNVTWVSSQRISCKVPALSPGVYSVAVMNPEGQVSSDVVNYEVVNSKWVQTDGGSCVTVCNAQGLVSLASSEGAYCASGEIIPASSRSVLKFTHGCKPNRKCVAQGPVSGAATSGQFCYGPRQTRNKERTDITVGCFCGL